MKAIPISLSIPVFNGNESLYLNECLASGWVSSSGPWVKRFEDAFASYVGAPQAVGVSSGTAALHLALISCGVESGDEVLVPTLTFIASVNSIAYVNAAPVFMDCDSHLNLDPVKVEKFLKENCLFDGVKTINKKTGRRVKALMPVHVFGNPVCLEPLLDLANEYNLSLIEDATESLGSLYTGGSLTGKRTGTLSDAGCFSFNGNKIITTGSGGMVVCRDPQTLKHVRYLSTQSKDDELWFVHHEIGYNYRLSSLQSSLGLAQLEFIEKIVEKKRQIHTTYRECLKGFEQGLLLEEPSHTRSNYWLNAFIFEESTYDRLGHIIKRMNEEAIEVRPVWKLNHEQKPFQKFQTYEVSKATNLHPRTLCLPSSPNLSVEDIERVVSCLKKACS